MHARGRVRAPPKSPRGCQCNLGTKKRGQEKPCRNKTLFFPLVSRACLGVVKARLSSFAFTVFGKAVQLLRTPYSVVALLVPCICPHTRILQLTTFGMSHQFCLPRPKLRPFQQCPKKPDDLGREGSRKAARRLHEAGRSHISHLRTLDFPQSPFPPYGYGVLSTDLGTFCLPF